MQPTTRPADYADLLGVPDRLMVEVVGGSLHASLRPTNSRAHAASVLGMDITAPFAWPVDGVQRTLEIFGLERGRWMVLATDAGDERVAARPFDAVPFDLGDP